MLQTLNFTAGGRQADAKADFFRYESCLANGADESVRVRADGNDLGLFLPGDFCSLNNVATRWEVIPITATATGTFRLGVGKVGSSRLTGTVRVVDQGADKSRSGNQFMSGPGNSAVLTVFSLISVYSTSKTVSIKRLQVASSSGGNVQIGRATGAPTVNPLAQGGMQNKLQGSALSDLQRALGTCASQQPTAVEMPGVVSSMFYPVSPNVLAELPLTTPIILLPGVYFWITSAAVNSSITMIIDWEEA